MPRIYLIETLASGHDTEWVKHPPVSGVIEAMQEASSIVIKRARKLRGEFSSLTYPVKYSQNRVEDNPNVAVQEIASNAALFTYWINGDLLIKSRITALNIG